MPTSEDIQAVYRLLEQAASQEAQLIQSAYTQLQQWETRPGFFTVIQEIFRNKAVDITIRQLAIIYFKNGIDKYWRKRAPNGISEQEKELLRVNLLDATLTEDIPLLFKQLAFLVSKAGRHDWPRDWSALLPTLAQTISSPDTAQRRLAALMTLHHVIKALASKTLSKQAFQEAATQFITGLIELWCSYVTSDNPHCTEAHFCAKILRRLICYGLSDLKNIPKVQEFLGMALEHIRVYTQQWYQATSHLEPIETSIKLLMKLILETRSHHPISYTPLLPGSLQLALHHIMNAHSSDRLHETFLIQCCRFVQNVVEETEYSPETNQQDGLMARNNIDIVLTNENIVNLAQTLVARYLILPPSALEQWEDSPEEYAYETADLSCFELQPCSESLFKSLVGPYLNLISPCILELLASTSSPIDPTDQSLVLARDAIYNTIGLAAYDLYGVLDFPQWLGDHFIPELAVMHTNYKIIRRRVPWLIEQWSDICKFNDPMQAHVYSLLISLHANSEDMVVRLTANNALRANIDSMNFRLHSFRPYMHEAIAMTFQLLNDVIEGDTKMNVLSTLSTIMARSRAEVIPYINMIATAIPELWQYAQVNDNNMLQCTIVTVMRNLVEAIGPESTNFQYILLPIIEFSTNKDNKASVYLMEDGVLLWKSVIQSTTNISPDLQSLFPRAVACLDSSDCVRFIISIINSYLILSPAIFEAWGGLLADAFLLALEEYKAEGLRLISDVIGTTIVAFREQACIVFEKCLMLMLSKIATRCEDDCVLVHYGSLFARVLVQHPDCFERLISHCNEAQTLPSPPMTILLTCWLDKLDSNIEHSQLKLTGLAIITLIGRQDDAILANFGMVINACVQVYTSLCLEDSKEDFLTWGDDEDTWSPEPGESPNITRDRQ
eukprot:Ihof_evm1s941 gene=Ihof_evmTU1s941